MRQKSRGVIQTEVKGWTPLVTSIVHTYGLYCAAVFGRMWRYCQMEDGVCNASQQTIADDLNITRATVNQCVEKLVENGYLQDLTPELRNSPHTYRDTGKVKIRSTIDIVETPQPERGVKMIDSKSGPGVNHFDTGVNDSNSGCQNDLHPGVNHFDLKKDSLRESLRNKESETASQLWQMITQQLRDEINSADYLSWVHSLRASTYQDGILTIRSVNSYARDWCESRLGVKVTRLATALAGSPTTVVFELESNGR